MWRVVVCDLETSKMRRLKPATGRWKVQPKGCNATKKNTIVVNRLRAESGGSESKIFSTYAFRILMSVG